MTIKLIDLYNSVASQSWSMFDDDAEENEDFNPALLSAINKALVEIWASYPFDFRKQEKHILTQKYINRYSLPDGTILQKKTKRGEMYSVMLRGRYLEFIEIPEELEFKTGKPNSFFIKNNKLCFYPAPDDTYEITIEYLTFAVGKDSDGKSIYALVDENDTIEVPQVCEQLFLNTLISKAMTYVLASPTDENYAGYNIQYEKSYKLLLKSVGGRKKQRRIEF